MIFIALVLLENAGERLARAFVAHLLEALGVTLGLLVGLLTFTLLGALIYLSLEVGPRDR